MRIRGENISESAVLKDIAGTALDNGVVLDKRDRPDIGGSCRLGKGQVCPGDSVKSMPEPGTERAIVDCAADLEQQIGAIS
jgi:hypothetical protein